MKQKINGAIDCIGAILVGSCKIVLFFVILAFLFVQVAWIFAISKQSDTLNSAIPGFVGLQHYAAAYASAIATVIGAYAILRSHQGSLRICAGSCAIIAFLLVIIVAARSNSLQESNKAFEDRLKSSFQYYNWYEDKPDAEVNEQTRTWDAVQGGLSCCGLKNPEDWKQFRPSSLDQDKYPSSCCFQYTPGQPAWHKILCSKSYNGLYDRGCLESIKGEEDFFYTGHVLLILGLAILASLSFVTSVAVGTQRTSSSLTIS